MALNAATVWEVRTTGSDTNGGGFNATRDAVNGVDYSQQDAAQLSLTDLACVAATTTLTSATGGFTHAMEGNLVYIASGTNAAAGFYEIVTYTNTNTVTIDRTCASGGDMSAGVGKVGGALASPGMAFSGAVGGNYVWVKAGTYTITSTSSNVSNGVVSLPGWATPRWTKLVGYNSSRGDNGTRPVLTLQNSLTTSAIYVVTSSGANAWVENISIDCGTGNTTATGIYSTNQMSVYRVKVTHATVNGINLSHAQVSISECEVSDGSGTSGINAANAVWAVYGCAVHDNTCPGFVISTVPVRCIAYGNSGASSDGFQITGYANLAVECTAYNNGRHGFFHSLNYVHLRAISCIAYGNTGKGFELNVAGANIHLVNCAYGSNTAGNYDAADLWRADSCQTLTADPFTNAAGGDFSLNTTAGGGAACRAAGWPGLFPAGLTTGYQDIGAAQHQDAGGGAIVALPHTQIGVEVL